MEVLKVSAASSSIFKDKKPVSVRIWHWTTFLVLSASMITVLFASTMFSTKSNVPMVTEQILKKGGAVTPVQARAVAHEYSDKLWMVHKYIGYGLSFLLLFRIVIEMIMSKEQRLYAKIMQVIKPAKVQYPGSDRKHYLFVKYGYLFFYLVLLVMVITGLGLAYEDVPFLKSLHKPLVQVHSIAQYTVYAYVVLHIVGVIRAEFTGNKGIVSAMINGDPN